jgi:hypothetical protein
VNKLLHTLAEAGATISVKKLQVTVPEAMVMGQLMTYEGRRPDRVKVVKIESWPECETVMDVQAFLGMAGTVRTWVKDFASITHPLVELTKKGVEWKWMEVERHAMEKLKAAVLASKAIQPIDSKSLNKVILAVDSSYIACDFILSQLDNENQQRPSCFGSITFNKHEAKYLQEKIELYGLFQSIHAVKLWIIGVLDTKYIKGMLSKPDMHPNAMINRWIEAISLFPFNQ